MHTSEKLIWRLYSGVLGAATTMIAQRALVKLWEVATGEEPPNPNDPDVPYGEAVTWAIATGVGVGVAQLSMNRYMSRRWWKDMGKTAPTKLGNRLTND